VIPHHVYYQLAILGLLWLWVMLYYAWPSRCTPSHPRLAAPVSITYKRSRPNEPKPFAGLTQRPRCAACEHEAAHPQSLPPLRPDPMPQTHRRPRVIDTSRHFCPHANCTYCGWLGLGNLRANGHPSGGPWRQFQCTSCEGYFLETHGTIFHGKRVTVELMVHVVACLAEGLGIRATARVFEVDPDTVLQWLVEAAEQLRAFSAYFLCDLHVEQLQLDEVYAVLRDLKAGAISDDEALKRLERSPCWVWTAIDPKSKLLVVVDVGTRTLAMAQRVVHQVTQVLAPGCVPLFLTDGFKEYRMAILAHFGSWMQPERRQAKGPLPQPRWMPLPQLLYAQVIKTVRRQRLVDVQHRVVFGSLEAVNHILAPLGWHINTAFVERINLTLRQHVAAVGRRVSTLCQGEDGLRQQVAVFHCYYNFCLSHASVRQPLPQLEPSNGTGSATQWRPCTPAMAAGLTDRVWSLKEVLLFRVPPWPQPRVR
jgi:transposase-like protein/IS1 family transposase